MYTLLVYYKVEGLMKDDDDNVMPCHATHARDCSGEFSRKIIEEKSMENMECLYL